MKKLLILVSCAALAQNSAFFPSSVISNSDGLIAADQVEESLASAVSPSSMTIPLTSASRFPAAGGVVSIEDEDVHYCSKTGDTLNVCASGRGFSGTSAAPHPSGALAQMLIVAWHHNQLLAEVRAIETALGASLSGIIASGATPQVAYYLSSTKLGPASGLLWNNSDLTINGSLGDQFQPSLILRPDPTTGFPIFANRTSNGTLSSPTATAVANFLGGFVTQGYNGSNFVDGGGVVWYANENWSTSANGSRMFFYVRKDGTNTDDTMLALNGTGPTLALGNKADETAFNGCVSGSVCVKDGLATIGDTFLVVKAGAGQSSNLQEWQNNSGGVLGRVDPGGALGPVAVTASLLPTCNSGTAGLIHAVSDSNTVTWGATVAGSSSNMVLAWCNGTSWTVVGK